MVAGDFTVAYQCRGVLVSPERWARKREKDKEKGSPVEMATGGDVLAALQFLVTLCHGRGVGMTRC